MSQNKNLILDNIERYLAEGGDECMAVYCLNDNIAVCSLKSFLYDRDEFFGKLAEETAEAEARKEFFDRLAEEVKAIKANPELHQKEMEDRTGETLPPKNAEVINKEQIDRLHDTIAKLKSGEMQMKICPDFGELLKDFNDDPTR